jgi:hypothetical protein
MKATVLGIPEGLSTFRVRLPCFLREDIGLGDLIKRITSAAGIRPCGGCLQRAEILNRWLTLTGQARNPGADRGRFHQ